MQDLASDLEGSVIMAPGPIKVMHVITTISVGGAEKMLHRLLQRNDPDRFAPRILTLMPPHESMSEQWRPLNIPTYSLNLRQAQLPAPSAIVKLSRILREVQPDLVQAWMYHGNLAATVGAWLAGWRGPILWNVRHSLHDIRYEKTMARWVIRLNALLSSRAGAIVYNAQTSIDQHEAFGFARNSSLLIPNGFDCDLYRPRPEQRARLRAELGIDESAPLIGMIARYHPMKDPINLLDALKFLDGAMSNAQLVIAGSYFDHDNAEIVGAIAERGLQNRVKLLGRREDIPQLLAALDVVAMPSGWGEGFPNAIGEAMAVGVPCVATNIGDAAVVVGEHGIVVPPRDSQALAAGLAELLSLAPAARQALGEAARRRIKTHFQIDTIVNQYRELHELFAAPTDTSIPTEVALQSLKESWISDV